MSCLQVTRFTGEFTMTEIDPVVIESCRAVALAYRSSKTGRDFDPSGGDVLADVWIDVSRAVHSRPELRANRAYVAGAARKQANREYGHLSADRSRHGVPGSLGVTITPFGTVASEVQSRDAEPIDEVLRREREAKMQDWERGLSAVDRLLCEVTAGQVSVGEAARRLKVDRSTVSRWRDRLLDRARIELAEIQP